MSSTPSTPSAPRAAGKAGREAAREAVRTALTALESAGTSEAATSQLKVLQDMKFAGLIPGDDTGLYNALNSAFNAAEGRGDTEVMKAIVAAAKDAVKAAGHWPMTAVRGLALALEARRNTAERFAPPERREVDAEPVERAEPAAESVTQSAAVSDPAPVAAESDPTPVAAESDLTVVAAESDLTVVATESDPAPVVTESDLTVVATESDLTVVATESNLMTASCLTVVAEGSGAPQLSGPEKPATAPPSFSKVEDNMLDAAIDLASAAGAIIVGIHAKVFSPAEMNVVATVKAVRVYLAMYECLKMRGAPQRESLAAISLTCTHIRNVIWALEGDHGMYGCTVGDIHQLRRVLGLLCDAEAAAQAARAKWANTPEGIAQISALVASATECEKGIRDALENHTPYEREAREVLNAHEEGAVWRDVEMKAGWIAGPSDLKVNFAKAELVARSKNDVGLRNVFRSMYPYRSLGATIDVVYRLYKAKALERYRVITTPTAPTAPTASTVSTAPTASTVSTVSTATTAPTAPTASTVSTTTTAPTVSTATTVSKSFMAPSGWSALDKRA